MNAHDEQIEQEDPRDTLVRTILECDCNMTEAAKKLGVAKSTLYSRLKSIGLSIEKLRVLKKQVPDIVERTDVELAAEKQRRCPACGEGMRRRRDSGTYRTASPENRLRFHQYDCGSTYNRVGHHSQTDKCKKIAAREQRMGAGAVA